MDPRLNEGEIALQQRARDAAVEHVSPLAVVVDMEATAPREALTALGETGILGVGVPEEDGGAGGGLVEMALVCEEIGAASASIATIVVGHVTAARLVAAGGSEAQKSGLLADFGSGARVAALGLDGGVSPLCDPALGATLRGEGTGATLTGTVAAVAGATVADIFVFGARGTADEPAVEWILAEATAEGITVGSEEPRLGLNGSGMAGVVLAGVRVGTNARLDGGAPASELTEAALDCARVGHAALCVGIGRAAFEAATKHVSASEEGLNKAQSIQWMLADMATETEAARLLTWHAATRTNDGELREAAAMARLMASDAAVRATRSAVQIFGSAGSTRAAGIERLYRDAKAMEVHHGASDAQRRAVARRLLPDLVD